MPTEHIAFPWEGGSLSGVWHTRSDLASCLVLAHGAGGNLSTPALVKFADALAARNVGVVRFNFPYAEARKRVPDRQPTLEAAYRAVATHMAGRTSRLFLGGRSMGGRIASHIVAAGQPAAGLVFLSYPLHPPGKPDRRRDAHLGTITVPMLFLQGTRDAFAQLDLLTQTVARLPQATLHLVDGADHGLTVRGRAADDVLTELAETTTTWMDGIR